MAMNDLKYTLLFVLLSVLIPAITAFSCDSSPVKAGTSAESPLSISAVVYKIQPRSDPPAGQIVFEVSMTIHFKNNGSSPVLLFVDELYPWLGRETLSISREDAISKRFVFISGGYLSTDRLTWGKIRQRLDRESPPDDLIRLIEPGAEWSFDKTVVLDIEIKGSFDQRSKPWDVIKEVDPLWLQLKFQLWPSNLEEDERNPKFGKSLQRRWEAHGQLILGYITSEPIALSLPDIGEKGQ